jgi:hypothetical protein
MQGLFELFDLPLSFLPLSPLPLEKIAQLACILGIIFLGELVANSPKIAHLFDYYLSYLG